MTHIPQYNGLLNEIDFVKTIFPVTILPVTLFPVTLFPVTLFPVTIFPVTLFPVTILLFLLWMKLRHVHCTIVNAHKAPVLY